MKQFVIECHESLSASDIFENLKQCYPQMIFDVTEQVRPTPAAPDECDLCGAPATTVKVSHYCAEHRSL
jgi:hypothetical protein